MIDLLTDPIFTLGLRPGAGESRTLPTWIQGLAQGTPLVPLRADRAMHLPLLMHLADLALAALAHDARVEGTPLDADTMLERFYGWTVTDWERALRSLAEDLPRTMFDLVVDEPTLPAYLQPPIADLLARKKKDLWRDADNRTPDELNPLGMRMVHDRHHGSWPGDPETWALALIVRETAAPGVGAGLRGALRGNARTYASIHAALGSAAMFRDDVERAIVHRVREEGAMTDKDRALAWRRRPALLWSLAWGREGFHPPHEVEPFFVAPAVPVRLVARHGGMQAIMLQANDIGEKWIARVRNGVGKPPTTRQLRDIWMAVEPGHPTEDDPDPLKPRGHLKQRLDQDIVVAFFSGTDGRSSDLPVAVILDRDDLVGRNGWGVLVLSGFVADRDTPYREVLIEIQVEPDDFTQPRQYLPARAWLLRLEMNNMAFHTAFNQLDRRLRQAFGLNLKPPENLQLEPVLKQTVDDTRDHLDAIFFQELRRGLMADDQGEGWRRLLREAALTAFDRFEREHPLEKPTAVKRFCKALGELKDDLAKL